MIPLPPKLDCVGFTIFMLSLKSDEDVPEHFGNKGLDAVVLVDDKAKGWELTWTWNRI